MHVHCFERNKQRAACDAISSKILRLINSSPLFGAHLIKNIRCLLVIDFVCRKKKQKEIHFRQHGRFEPTSASDVTFQISVYLYRLSAVFRVSALAFPLALL